MKIVNKGNGVFTVAMENENDTTVPKSLFYKSDAEEIIFPEGIKVINDEAMCFCYSLKKVYLPSTIEQIKYGIFYGMSQHAITIYFDGSVSRFKKISKPYKEIITVNIPGPYDGYPYYSTEGSYNEEREEMRYFDAFCSKIEVICNDNQKLYYGYSNSGKKN